MIQALNNNNNKNSNMGRPTLYRWPGLEELTEKIDEATLDIAGIRLSSSIIPHTRREELALAEKEAARREKEYAGGENNADADAKVIEIDFESLRFDTGSDGAHTTIDFDKVNDTKNLATVTTNDFVIFNRIKKILFGEGGGSAAARGWNIIDIKFNQPKTALFFITILIPVPELKKILNKF